MLFRHSEVLQVGILVVLSLMEVCDVLLGTPEVSLDQFFLSRRAENSNSKTSKSFFTTTFHVFRKYMEEMSISRC